MYHHIFAAGTFDGLHDGHQAFLARAFQEGDKVTIGITSDAFAKQVKPTETIQPFVSRRGEIEAWLVQKGYKDHAEVISIDDSYEPAASGDYDAIVVTKDNIFKGNEINAKRQERKLAPLGLVEVMLLMAADGKPISSTRVRKGEIDATGYLVMPDSLRPELSKALGTLLMGEKINEAVQKHKNDIIFTVGDETTMTFLRAGIVPSLSIIDLKVKRQPVSTMDSYNDISVLNLLSIKSGPGYISQEAVAAIRSWDGNGRKRVIVIDGEEDLLTLPAVLYSPDGALVYYGQPNEGLVEIICTPQKKQEIKKFLNRFV